MRFGPICPDANAPLFATTWWFTVSTFFHVTVSPPAIVTVFGAKPVDLMFTVLFAARPAAARAHDAVASARAFFIWRFPLSRSLTGTYGTAWTFGSCVPAVRILE